MISRAVSSISTMQIETLHFILSIRPSKIIMSFITQKIVANPNIQIKLRQEIDTVLNELNDNIIHEIINQLEYLNVIVKEALRLFSPSILERVCNRAFELPPALPGKKPFISK